MTQQCLLDYLFFYFTAFCLCLELYEPVGSRNLVLNEKAASGSKNNSEFENRDFVLANGRENFHSEE